MPNLLLCKHRLTGICQRVHLQELEKAFATLPLQHGFVWELEHAYCNVM